MKTMNAIKITALILVTVITLSLFTVILTATAADSSSKALSYKEYFSEERTLLQYPLYMTDESYIMPLALSDNIETLLPERYLTQSRTDIKIGSLCVITNINGVKSLKLIADGRYSCVSSAGRYIYAVENSSVIYRFDSLTMEKSFILKTDSAISALEGYDDLLYYQTDNIVYRYHIPSGKTDTLLTVTDGMLWKPRTNYIIEVISDNQDYYDCLEKADCDLDSKIPDADAFYKWFTTEYNSAELYVEKEPALEDFKEYPLTELLCDVYGIYPQKIQYYSSQTGLLSESHEYSDEYYNDVDEFCTKVDETAMRLDTEYQGQTRSRAYSSGDYFSQTGTYCTCHGYLSSCDTTYSGNCDCILYQGGIQCAGYARWVFYEDNGTNSYTTYMALGGNLGNTAGVINYFGGVPKTAYMQVVPTDGGDHKFALISSTAYGFTICHANTAYGGISSRPQKNCLIFNSEYITFANIATRYSTLVTTRVTN